VFVGMMLIGAVDEFHQLQTPGRSGGDGLDWLADSAGGFLGAVVVGWLYGRGKDRRTRGESGVVAQGD
jgi:VanZ family protein